MFRLTHPRSTRQALADFAGNAAWLAGGQALLPAIAHGRQFDLLVDLGGIAGLGGIQLRDTHLAVGAMCSAQTLATHALVRQHLPALADLAASLIRTPAGRRGTLGGATASGAQGTGPALALLALDAVIETSHGAHDANDYFAAGTTLLAEGELILRVEFRIPLECAFRAGRHTVVGARFAEGHRVARGSARQPARRWPAAESLLDANAAAEAPLAARLQALDG